MEKRPERPNTQLREVKERKRDSSSIREGVIFVVDIEDMLPRKDYIQITGISMLVREQRQRRIWACILYTIAVHLVFFATGFVEHDLCFSLKADVFGKPVLFAEFLLATAAVIVIWVRKLRD